jgi:hypothetical protein
VKIIVERFLIDDMLTLMERHDPNASTEETDHVTDMLRKILKDHPIKTDGVLGVEIDEWPDYAPEQEPDNCMQNIEESIKRIEAGIEAIRMQTAPFYQSRVNNRLWEMPGVMYENIS